MAFSSVPFIEITGFIWPVVHPKMAHRKCRQSAFIFTVLRRFLSGPGAYVRSVIIFETTVCRHHSLAGHSWGGHTLLNVCILQFTQVGYKNTPQNFWWFDKYVHWNYLLLWQRHPNNWICTPIQTTGKYHYLHEIERNNNLHLPCSAVRSQTNSLHSRTLLALDNHSFLMWRPRSLLGKGIYENKWIKIPWVES